jgi:3-oxoacyl-[acyl-carrier protein] reductase
MDLNLGGKVAIVTGGSLGIGRAVAAELAGEGAQVIISARKQEGLDKAAASIKEKTGEEVHTIAADMAKQEDITRMVEEVAAKFGRVDILIANAGLGVWGDFLTIPDSETYYDIEVSFMGVTRCCRAVIPHMQKNQWGRIVIMASKVGKEPSLVMPLSSAIKSAQINLGKSLSKLYGKDGILVNTIKVGPTWTELAEDWTARRVEETGKTFEELKAQRGSSTVLKRNGTPEEISGITAFLCSDRASFITGAAIEVDGGAQSGTG